MAEYRKKPVVIQAFQYDGDLIDRTGAPYAPEWAMAAFHDGVLFYDSLGENDTPTELFIRTLEGTHHVSVDDYVIRGVKGELYPCKPDIFAATYEDASAPDEIAALRAENERLKDRWEETASDNTGYRLTHFDGIYALEGPEGAVICEFIHDTARAALGKEGH